MTLPLNDAERVSLDLRQLYQSYGYRPYKVGKFEEYDLYSQNRNFLTGDRILTFTDTDGRLMALKPDVTLSIVKNTRDDQRMRKVWYTENVYRVPRNAYGFQEIVQTGLECIGPVDDYAMAEVLMLAARSLEVISPEYVLDLSHMGVLTGILSSIGASAEFSAEVLDAAAEKNLHGLRSLCQTRGLESEEAELLENVCCLSGPAEESLSRLLKLPLPEESMAAAMELRRLLELLAVFGKYRVNLDFSVTNDTDYYNGLVFRGFVDGVASMVLSGGRYDPLLRRMGKTGEAVGFAVYLSELERLFAPHGEYDVDTLLVYDEGDDLTKVAAAVKALAEAGQTVRAQRRGEPAVTWRRMVDAEGREVKA